MMKTLQASWRHYVNGEEDVPEWVSAVVAKTSPKTPEGQEQYWFDWREADRRVKFIEDYCRYPEGPKAGDKMLLDDWQKNDIVRPTFGWKRRGSAINKHGDLRRYSKVFVAIPRKNAKSTLIAAMALSIMLQDGEISAEIYAMASNAEQADRVYRPVKKFIEMDKRLQDRLQVLKGKMLYNKFSSELRVLSTSTGKHGLNTHAVLIDELHEFTKPVQLEALEALTSSMLSRSQPLEFIMTTAGSDTTSVCYHEWQKALSIQDGSVVSEFADMYLPVVYAASADDDWHDPDVWRRANPGLGSILTMDNFRKEYLKAKDDPRALNTFLRLHLNIWTHSDERWIMDEVWMRGYAEWPDEAVQHLPCYIGMDLASRRDFCAVSMMWVDEARWKFYLRVKFFLNEEAVRNPKLSRGIDYLDFEREGSLIVTGGNATDHNVIRDFVMEFSSRNQLRRLAYDQYGATTLIPQLIDAGIDCVPFSQGILSVSNPIKEFDVEVGKGNIIHDGSRCMRWQMGCVQLHTDNSGNVKIIKHLERYKVDGPVSAIMAFGQFLKDRQDPVQDIVPVVIGLD